MRSGGLVRRAGAIQGGLTVRSTDGCLAELPGSSAGGATEPTSSQEGTYSTMKTVFTTGEAAKICKVSQQTIIRCFDSGQLKGFRVPGSRFRRIPREALYRFMKDNGIPTDALESGKRRILIVDDDQAVVDLITEVLGDRRPVRDQGRQQRLRRRHAGQGVSPRPDHPRRDAAGHQRQGSLRADPQPTRRWPTSRSSASRAWSRKTRSTELRIAGADDFLHKPLDIDELIAADLPTLGYGDGRDRLTAFRPALASGGRAIADQGSRLLRASVASPTGRSPVRCVPRLTVARRPPRPPPSARGAGRPPPPPDDRARAS